MKCLAKLFRIEKSQKYKTKNVYLKSHSRLSTIPSKTKYTLDIKTLYMRCKKLEEKES